MATAEQAWKSALAQVTIADLAASIDVDSDGTAITGLSHWLTPPAPGQE